MPRAAVDGSPASPAAPFQISACVTPIPPRARTALSGLPLFSFRHPPSPGVILTHHRVVVNDDNADQPGRIRGESDGDGPVHFQCGFGEDLSDALTQFSIVPPTGGIDERCDMLPQ
jgi:hypothetical protein